MSKSFLKTSRRSVFGRVALGVFLFTALHVAPALADPDKVRLLAFADEPDPFSPGIVDEQKDLSLLTLELAVRKTDGLRALEQQAGPADDKRFVVRFTWEVYLPPPEDPPEPPPDGEEPQETRIVLIEQEFPLEPPFETVFLPLERGNAEGEFVKVVVESVWDGIDTEGEPVPDGTYLYRFSADVVRIDVLGNGDEKESSLGDVASDEETPGEVTVDNTPPQITASLTPPANANGWNSTDVTVTFDCADELGVEECPEPVFVTGDCVEQEVTGTATDTAGNTTTVAVVVRIDKLPPSVSGAFDVAPNANGWNNTPLTATFEAADGCSGVLSLTPPVLLAGEGANQEVTGTAVDLAGNAASVTLTASIDLTPPVVSAASSPPANAAGWNASDVTVAFDCTDALSGVETCPDPVVVSDDCAEQEVSGTAVDLAGNTASAATPVKLDKLPPEVSGTTDPPKNVNGWNNTPVTASFEATDACSGVAEVSPPETLDGEGADQEVTGTATDLAGNTAGATVTASIDLTPPELFAASSPPANAVGWNQTDVSVAFECTDALSGVEVCPDSVLVSEDCAELDVGGQAVDLAGNTATLALGVKLDKLPPVVIATADPPANGAGWNNTPVTASFDAADACSGVTSVTPPVVLGNEGTNQEVIGTATDLAGNIGTASVVASIDLTPPTVTATADPPPNAAGWNNTAVSVAFDCQDALSGVASCPATVTLANEGAAQDASGEARDAAGNVAVANVAVSIDTTPPVFDPAQFRPIPCPELTLELQAQVRACFADALAGVAAATVTLTVDGVDHTADAAIAAGCIAWDPPAILAPGEHQAAIVARDQAGNAGAADWCFDVASPSIEIAIDSPAIGLFTDAETVDVAGTVEAIADTVEVDGVVATLAAGTFAAQGVPLREGKNVLTAIAKNAAGGIGTATVSVYRDTTAPVVRIETPRDGAVLTSLQVDVAGLVNDLVTGTTINADDCDVRVNGVQAAVANRSFVVSDLLLKRGVNTIVAEARDRVGNVATSTIQVTVEDRAGQRILLLAGNNQVGGIFEELADPLIVALEDANGDPVVGRPVTFAVTRGDGVVRSFPEEGGSITVLTDDFGTASVLYQLSGRSGAGNNRVLATAPGFLGEVEFCASALTGVPARVTAISGNDQRGVVEKPLPLSQVVLVTDAGGNAVAGVPVSFEVVRGGGSIDGEPQVVKVTDQDGLAEIAWTLGPEPGVANNVLEVTASSLESAPTAFVASALRVGRPSDTSLSGVVLDNQDNPIEGVTIYLKQTGTPTSSLPKATSDAEGRFHMTGVPVGTLHVIADGSTALRPGNWPLVAYDFTTIAGQDNQLDQPVWLLPLADNEVVVPSGGPAADVTLLLPGVSGAEITIFKNSVTCPAGLPDCRVSWTQVRGERIPMEPPLGSTFMLAGTFQPPGARYNPPARLCIPNADQLPGAQVEMFSFDHDLGEFIAIGTATVTADGAQICSDPGFGLVKGGWHGCVPPPPPCTSACGSCPDPGECFTYKRDCPQCGPANCNKENKPDGTFVKNEEPGDCFKTECMGGSPSQVGDASETPTDPPVQDAECKKCTENGPEADTDKDGTIVDDCKICKDGTAEEAMVEVSGVPDKICVDETVEFTAKINPDAPGITGPNFETPAELTITGAGDNQTASMTGVAPGDSDKVKFKAYFGSSPGDCDTEEFELFVLPRNVEGIPGKINRFTELSFMQAECPDYPNQDEMVDHEVDGCSGGVEQDPMLAGATFTATPGMFRDPPRVWNQAPTTFGAPQANIAHANVAAQLNPLPCNNHDICYQTCGNTQNQCDMGMHNDMNTVCGAAYPAACPGGLTPEQCMAYADERTQCFAYSDRYFDGLDAFGTFAWTQRQTQYCLCCEAPTP